MALAEKAIKEVVTRTAPRYDARVRGLAAIYVFLNLVSIAIIVTILWRGQFFVTLSQRSNIETLTLAIVLVLAVYYVATTFSGFVGAIRMLVLNAGDRNREERKHRAMRPGRESKYVTFDQEIRLQGKPDQNLTWEVADEAGKLGDIEIDGVKVTFYPQKDGISDTFFEFFADQIEDALKKRDLEASVQITQWSSIDEDQASSFYSIAQAFRQLERHLGTKEPLWPTSEITQEEVEEIGRRIRELVPTLRSESLLPHVNYAVEYNVPILPEPLGMVRLTRKENRADPLISMGCASIIMLFVMAILTFIILLPPWVPSA
jgi:hypothetical protein